MSPPKNAPDLASNQPPPHPPEPSSTPGTATLLQTGGGVNVHAVLHFAGGDATPDPSQSQKRRVSADHGSSFSQTPSRSIAMQSILNPLDVSIEPRSRHGSREPFESPRSAPASPSSNIRPPVDTLLPFDQPGLSPRTQTGSIFIPRSPGRAASLGGRFNSVPGTMNVTQSPFVQSPQPQTFSTEHTGRIIPESFTGAGSNRFQYGGGGGRMRSVSFFAEHRSAHVGSRPHSQDTSPSTPQSTYSPFSQTPPSSRPHYAQQPPPHPPPPFPHTLPPPAGRPVGESSRPLLLSEGASTHPSEIGYQQPPPKNPLDSGSTLIPVSIDLESGSRKADSKRKKNSEASKKFRERKKAGEAEQQHRLERQADEIKFLKEERDFYLAERDFFRDLYGRNPGFSAQSRPPSPRLRRRPPEAQSQAQQEQDLLQGENRENYGRNVRPRIGSAPSSLSSHGTTTGSFQHVSPFPPASHTRPQYPVNYAPSWTAPRGAPVPSASHPQPLPHPAATQAPPSHHLPPGYSYHPREGPLPPRSQSS